MLTGIVPPHNVLSEATTNEAIIEKFDEVETWSELAKFFEEVCPSSMTEDDRGTVAYPLPPPASAVRHPSMACYHELFCHLAAYEKRWEESKEGNTSMLMLGFCKLSASVNSVTLKVTFELDFEVNLWKGSFACTELGNSFALVNMLEVFDSKYCGIDGPSVEFGDSSANRENILTQWHSIVDGCVDDSIQDCDMKERACCSTAFDDKIVNLDQYPSLIKELRRHQIRDINFMVARETAALGVNSFLYTEIALPKGEVCWISLAYGTVLDKAPSPEYGGILADESGMGKKTTCLALALGSGPEWELGESVSQLEYWRCYAGTLIVCDDAEYDSWCDEAMRMSRLPSFDTVSILLFKASEATPDVIESISNYDIVICTYSDLEETDGTDSENVVDQGANPCFMYRHEWHRVILHCCARARNDDRILYLANCLKTKFKWGVTGFPCESFADVSAVLHAFLKSDDEDGVMAPFDSRQSYVASHPRDSLIPAFTFALRSTAIRHERNGLLDGERIVLLPNYTELCREYSLEYVDPKAHEEVTRYREELRERWQQITSQPKFKVLKARRDMLTDLVTQYLRLCAGAGYKEPELFNPAFYLPGASAGENLRQLPLMCGLCHGVCDDDICHGACENVMCRSCVVAWHMDWDKTRTPAWPSDSDGKHDSCPMCSKPCLPSLTGDTFDEPHMKVVGAKIDIALDLLRGNCDKTVVFSNYSDTLRRLEKRLRVDTETAVFSVVDVSDPSKVCGRLEDFRLFGKPCILLIPTQLCCVDLDLGCATRCVVLDPSLDGKVNRRAVQRVNRIDRPKKPLHVDYVIFGKTIEDHLYTAYMLPDQESYDVTDTHRRAVKERVAFRAWDRLIRS